VSEDTGTRYRRPPTAQAAVLEELRRAITLGELKPGQAIRQDAVAERLSVSRVPVREALKVLEAEGQITYAPHRGYRVAQLSLRELEELYLLRRLLETEAVSRAVPKMTAVLLHALKDLLAQMDDCIAEDYAHTPLRFREFNYEFHFAIFTHSDLPRLVHHLKVLWANSDPYRSVSLNRWEPRHLAQEDHHALVRACERRDAEEAVAVMDRHRAGTIAHLRSLLPEDEGKEPPSA
jgi:DNA-binding GntR family transcriptional regulator